MLDKLTIKNFRIFEDFHIEGLRRVNLIAGKNNTGKTVLLEALRIWAAKGDVSVVNHSLMQRNQFQKGWDSSYNALFNRKRLEDGYGSSIMINELEIQRKPKRNGEFEYQVSDGQGGFQQLNSQFSFDNPKDKAIFVPVVGMYQNIEALWNNVVLTDLEEDVIKILQETVEPHLVRLDVSQDQTKVRLKGDNDPLPIQSLGDGVQRMLLLALSLVNAKGKYLLIDEMEIGLHYSIQEKLWEMLFYYCRIWDIQAFITTHSDDIVRSFFFESSKQNNTTETFFFRLQFDFDGKLEAIPYGSDDFEYAVAHQLETR